MFSKRLLPKAFWSIEGFFTLLQNWRVPMRATHPEPPLAFSEWAGVGLGEGLASLFSTSFPGDCATRTGLGSLGLSICSLKSPTAQKFHDPASSLAYKGVHGWGKDKG